MTIAQVSGPKCTGSSQHKRKIAISAIAGVIVVAFVISGAFYFGKSTTSNRFAVTGGTPYPLSVLLADTTPARFSLPQNYHSNFTAEIATIPSRSSFLKTLDADGVTVGYDGVTFSNSDIASGEATCLQSSIELATTNAEVQGLDPSTAASELESSPYCLDQSIALAVFKQAAEQAAISSGNGATLAQAQAFAQQQLATTEELEAGPNPPQLPAGQTPESITMCSSCILGYQQDLNFQYETALIGGTTSGPAQSTALVNWFSNVMNNASSLTIANVPSVTAADMASFLPWAREMANAP